jgi:hypothetical protein
MTQWLLIRRLRGPAFLLLIGIMAMLHEWTDFGFGRSWPLLLILGGLLALAERAALAQADLEGYDPVTGQPIPPDTPFSTSGYRDPGTSIIPTSSATAPGSDPDTGRP